MVLFSRLPIFPIIFKVGVLGSRSKYGLTQWDQPNFFKLGKKKIIFGQNLKIAAQYKKINFLVKI